MHGGCTVESYSKPRRSVMTSSAASSPLWSPSLLLLLLLLFSSENFWRTSERKAAHDAAAEEAGVEGTTSMRLRFGRCARYALTRLGCAAWVGDAVRSGAVTGAATEESSTCKRNAEWNE